MAVLCLCVCCISVVCVCVYMCVCMSVCVLCIVECLGVWCILATYVLRVYTICVVRMSILYFRPCPCVGRGQSEKTHRSN